MSKSILVIDTPECCGKCPCFLEVATDCCGVNGKDIDSSGKPDWCPLQDVPRRKMLLGLDGASNAMEIRERGRQEGYNPCIDEILKGANGDE